MASHNSEDYAARDEATAILQAAADFACVAAATGGSGSLKRTREYAPGIAGSMPTALKSSPAQPPPLLLNVASSAKPCPRALGDDSDSSEDLTTYICRTFRQKHIAELRGSVLVNQCDPICASARPTRIAAPSTGGAELATPSQLRCDTATSAADASTDRAEPTTAGCGGKTLTWLPNPAWQQFASQAHVTGYPISFELQHSCVECKACLLRILNSVNNHGKLCYVGTTENPIRRWAGDKRPIPATCAAKPHAQSQVKGGRGLLAKGHGKRFDHMTVLALVPQRTVAHCLEPFLIKVAKWDRGDQCVNKAEDARGQSQEDQYLYVCVGELPRDNPFPYSVSLYPNALKFTPQ